MKVLIQRVSHAEVVVAAQSVGKIGEGLLAFVGIERDDNAENLTRMAKKLVNYRIFPDADNKMNLSVLDKAGEVLAVSQFTLAANTQKGLRPSFSSAAPPEHAEALFNLFIEELLQYGIAIATGKFGADMKVSLLNDGPVTFLLES